MNIKILLRMHNHICIYVYGHVMLFFSPPFSLLPPYKKEFVYSISFSHGHVYNIQILLFVIH